LLFLIGVAVTQDCSGIGNDRAGSVRDLLVKLAELASAKDTLGTFEHSTTANIQGVNLWTIFRMKYIVS
jgi:hypothetical protein